MPKDANVTVDESVQEESAKQENVAVEKTVKIELNGHEVTIGRGLTTEMPPELPILAELSIDQLRALDTSISIQANELYDEEHVLQPVLLDIDEVSNDTSAMAFITGDGIESMKHSIKNLLKEGDVTVQNAHFYVQLNNYRANIFEPCLQLFKADPGKLIMSKRNFMAISNLLSSYKSNGGFHVAKHLYNFSMFVNAFAQSVQRHNNVIKATEEQSSMVHQYITQRLVAESIDDTELAAICKDAGMKATKANKELAKATYAESFGNREATVNALTAPAQ